MPLIDEMRAKARTPYCDHADVLRKRVVHLGESATRIARASIHWRTAGSAHFPRIHRHSIPQLLAAVKFDAISAVTGLEAPIIDVRAQRILVANRIRVVPRPATKTVLFTLFRRIVLWMENS